MFVRHVVSPAAADEVIVRNGGFQPDLGHFLKSMMAILANRSMTSANKLAHGGMLIQQKIGSGQASVMLYDHNSHQLKVVAASRPEIVGMTQTLSTKSISGYVCIHKQPLLIDDIVQDVRFDRSRASYRTASLISVPLLSEKDTVLGVINVSDKINNQPFNADDLAILLEYAGWITPLIDNLFIQDQLEREKERYRELAQELEIKQKELIINSVERSELVQMVVHDFKSPLSAVISNLDLLFYLGPSKEQQPIITTALQGASKLLEMIDEFLHLARVDEWRESGGKIGPVSFPPIITKQIEGLSPLALEKNITIENTCAKQALVLGERTLLGHLVQNLLSNAIKYSPENSLIRLGMEQWQSRRVADPTTMVLKFWIEDHGPGIADEYKIHIFEKFVRTDSSIDSGIKGTGIGLFICKKIVTMFKGKIWVEDNNPSGSRFCVILFMVDDTSE